MHRASAHAQGFHERGGGGKFLRPRLRTLSDPFLLPNMQAAVARILGALDRRERIVVFGDYDVDGVTSLALLAECCAPMAAHRNCFCPCG